MRTQRWKRATQDNSGVCIFSAENGKMWRKTLKPKYPGLNPLVRVNELLLFSLHRGDQTTVGEYIREQTQSNKGSSVQANKHNVKQWLEVKARQIQTRIAYPLINTEGD